MTTKPTKKSASASSVKLQTSGTARAAASKTAGKSASSKSGKTSTKTAGGTKLSAAKATKKPAAKTSAKPAKLSHEKAAPTRAERPVAVRAASAATKAGAKTRSVAKASKTSPLQQTNTPVLKSKKPSKASSGTEELSSRDKERRKLALSAAELAIELALDKKAVGPVLIDVSSQASYTDYIGIVSGRSDRQVEAIADHVSTTMKSQGWTLVGREGTSNGRWTLLDFGDMILHIFYHPVRDIYDIEGLWVGAPRVPLKNVPAEAMQFQGDALYAQS